MRRRLPEGATLLAAAFVVVTLLAAPRATAQVSAFLERELATGKIAGSRLAWNMGESLRDAARRTGCVRLR